MTSNKRWLYLCVGTLLLIFCGLIYGWSLFRTPFSEVYTDWSLSQLSMTFTISMVFFCVGGFVAGKLAARFKPQLIILLSAVCLLIGFFGVSRLNPENTSSSLIMLYIFYGFFGGSGVGLTYNCVIGTMNKWFPDKPGLCSGIMMMGFGLGALILGSVATSLIASKGIFTTFMILGIMIFVVLGVGSFFIKVPEAPAGSGQAKELYGDPIGTVMKTASFWCFLLWCVLISVGGLMVINSAASIAVAFGAPAIVGMVVSVFNGTGRVIVGGIYDKTNGKTAMMVDIIFMFVGGIALLLGAKTGSMILILVGLLAMGLSYGANPTICSTLIQKYYGPKYFAVNFGVGMFNLVPAAIIGPTISSSLVEKSGGAYDSSFVAILIFAVLALIMWVVVSNIIKKENSRREEPRPF